MPRLWPLTIGMFDQIHSRKDKKSSTPVGQSNQNKTAMVAESHEDGEEAFTSVNLERPRSNGNSKNESNLNRLTSNDEAIYSVACIPRVMMVKCTLE